jgi:Tfp pilus assembly protein PilF
LALLLLAAFGVTVGVLNFQARGELGAAKEALKAQKLHEALDHLENCLAVWPWEGEAHLLAARTARRLGKYDLAKRHLDRCEELGWSPDAIELEQALMEAQHGDFASVENALRNVIIKNKENPETALVLEVLAKKYLASFRYDDAQLCLHLWLERDPTNLTAMLWQSWVYGQASDFENSEIVLRRAAKLYPDDEETLLNLANTLRLRRRPKQALAYYRRLAERQGDAAGFDVLLGMAQCNLQLGQRGRARKLLRQALAKDPHNAKALFEYAQLAENDREMEKRLRAALKEEPFDPQANYHLYLCLLRDPKRQKEARYYLAKFKRIDAGLARINQLIKELRGSASPVQPAREFELGVLYLDLGQKTGAFYWLNRALEHDPGNRQIQEALARYYAQVGDMKKANAYRLLAQGASPQGRR